MKRFIQTLLIIMLLSGIYTLPIHAGSINDAEQRLIDRISSVYTYRNALYKVKDVYIEKGISRLSQDDVNLTDAQADEYLDMFYENIRVLISQGYMEKVKDLEVEEKTDKGKDKEITNNLTDNDNYESNADTGEGDRAIEIESSFEELTGIEETTIEYAVTDDANIVDEELMSDEEMISSSDISEEDIVVNEMVTNSFSEEEVTESVETEENRKDYFNAEPFRHGISLGAIAIGMVALVAVVLAVIVLVHKNKRYKRK